MSLKLLFRFFLGNIYLISLTPLSGQISEIEKILSPAEAESHLRFLTADELRGRNTGTVELNIAGRYIAEQFRKYGLKPMGDQPDDFLQKVPLYQSAPPTVVELELAGFSFSLDSTLAFVNGLNLQDSGPLLYVEDPENLENLEVKGKYVVMILRDIRQSIFNPDHLNSIAAKGAKGLIEIFGAGQQFPWPAVSRFLNREKIAIGDPGGSKSIPHLLIKDDSNTLIPHLRGNNPDLEVNLEVGGLSREEVEAHNIVGMVPGSDPALSDEYIVMCAHYDHVGISWNNGQDSIYNGTRDNGIGTTGLINAAQYFGQNAPKRSLIIIALTGEEKGLLGSQYYTMDPKVPLEQTVFAFNIDNSGYTDTKHITLLDTARTNIDHLVYQAADEVGLAVMGDRIPSQNYYERSDQVSFANKGVPAVNFKMAMETFDERISEFYHRPNDEFKSVDLEYIHKYWKAFIRSAELIANWEERPFWMQGDKFEEAGKNLYKMN